jgi:FtsH-binding integral membrane protein
METRSAGYITARRVAGRVDTIGAHAVFGEVMGLVAATLSCAALGAYVARDLGRTPAVACAIAGCVSLCLTGGAARRSERQAITALFAGGLLIGFGLAPLLGYYAHAHPSVVWHAAATSALFTSVLGATGYAIRRDLSGIGRALVLLLAATLIAALATALISTGAADRGYSIAWVVVFGGFTVVDFNLMRRAGVQDVVPLAAGVFLDILNLFLALLELLGSDGDS